jgi:hypothetical protein
VKRSATEITKTPRFAHYRAVLPRIILDCCLSARFVRRQPSNPPPPGGLLSEPGHPGNGCSPNLHMASLYGSLFFAGKGVHAKRKACKEFA